LGFLLHTRATNSHPKAPCSAICAEKAVFATVRLLSNQGVNPAKSAFAQGFYLTLQGFST